MLGIKDKKILYELEQNSRQSLSQIAKKTKLSQQVISYRLDILQREKIITNFFTLINFTNLGYTSYRIMLRLSNTSKQKYKEIIDLCVNHPNVLWLNSCGGKYDFIINIMAKNIIHFDQIFRKIKEKFPEQIQNYDILTHLEMSYFGRDYLVKKKRETEQIPYFGRELKVIKLNKTDLKILNILSENARVNIIEIASQLKITANTIVNRIKNLEKSGIIQAYKPLLHVEKIGYQSYKLLIKFQDITEQKEKQLINFVQRNANVIGIIKLVGLWDFEIEVEVESYDKLYQFVMDVRDEFKEIIKEFETLSLHHDYRYNFFPKDLLK